MALNVNTSNYINTQTTGSGSSQNVSGSTAAGSEGALVSVKGMDLKAGQTLSGQVVEVDGKEIKLLLSNNQMINAKLEGNINALLGQTLSFEVKGTENGQTALRPLYTNLNNSPAVANALTSAGLPHTADYAKMVSTMMDEGMPINRNALYDMSKSVNSFPAANPETIVKLNKLGLQVNELTINQYENYKGLERQIIGDVNTLTKGLSDMIKDSLSQTLAEIGTNDSDKGAAPQGILAGGKNLLSAFINAFSGNVDKNAEVQNAAEQPEILSEDAEISEQATTQKTIDPSVFDTAKLVLDMVETDEASTETIVNNKQETDAASTAQIENKVDNQPEQRENIQVQDNNLSIEQKETTLDTPAIENTARNASENLKGLSLDLLKNLGDDGVELKGGTSRQIVTEREVIDFAKEILNRITENPEKISESAKEKLTKLLSEKEFGSAVKDALSKQILLKPDTALDAKALDDVYSKITKQAAQAMEIISATGKENPELMNAAKNISDNVQFMNELNQVATYVQLPLLMNNKSAHGDLYVYTNKKSLKEKEGDISALLHLDMENLGPMDIYVKLAEGKKLSTHFYLQDEATIDFIADHIDLLNKRLTDKGYNIETNMTVTDKSKKSTNMADEFMKDEHGKEGMTASKFSFDVRA